MNRRLFVGQVAAGLSVCIFPPSLVASSLSPQSTTLLAPDMLPFDAVERFVQQDLAGTIQRVAFSYAYSPEQTPIPSLLSLVRSDMERVGQLVGKALAVDTNQLLVDSPSAAFGSYSARFEAQELTIVWQVLARIGSTVRAPTKTIQLYGSKGILKTVFDGRGYEFIDWQGRTSRMEKQTAS